MSIASRLPEPVKALLRPAVRLIRGTGQDKGPYRAVVDGINAEGVLRGWVYDRRTRKGNVAVGLYAGKTLIEAGTAHYDRDDVAVAHGVQATCGFQFLITDALLKQVTETGGLLVLRTMGADAVELGRVPMVRDLSDPAPQRDDITALALALEDDLTALLGLLEGVGDAPEAPAPHVYAPFERHGRMFTTEPVIPGLPASGHPAYLDYVRYRYRMDERYDVAPGLETADRFLFWYITAYRGQERRRIPLSNDLLDYLNAPITMGGHTYSLSRIMWWRMAGRLDMMGRVNLNDRDSYLDVLFWWAHQDCPHLYFEDCLVPDRFADLLRGVHPSRRLDAYPLSYFTDRFFRDTPRLHFLKPGTAEGRKALALAMLVKAAKRPDLLRYIPHTILNKLLDAGPDGGPSEFETFVNALLAADVTRPKDAPERPDRVALSRARYAHALRGRDFDLTSYRFLTRTPEGHRFEAAAMPRPDAGEEVQVQLIGPLAKASGLGQATRLSAEILRNTGLQVRGVDFDLDNPAPEGFSSDTMIEDYGPAKINIIHLNAESIPLAFAYQPDVFSGRYNIGYFFWELDQPAYCHYLGMDLLDEIWVSTEYGVQIYTRDDHGKPVVNVGMCYEDTPGLTRADARAFVNRRFLFDDSHYVCLVAFDSFSFVQRKNPVAVLQAFQKAFRGVPNARLVVKTQNRDSVFDTVQVQLWDRVDTIVASDPRIVVINETLSYRDLLRLKAGSDCYISLHKSEGWGFGMIEAMNLKVPVVCTAYSGNMDFCSDDTAWLVDYTESPLEKGEYIFVRKGSVWAEPSVEHAAKQLRAAYDNPAERQARAEAAFARIRRDFSAQAIATRYGGRLREILDGL